VFLGPPHPTDKKGTPTITVPYSYFLEEDLACKKKAVSEVAMANADVLDDSDDYKSIMDRLAYDISPEAIKEVIFHTEKDTIIITDTQDSVHKSSMIYVKNKNSPINVDKVQINIATEEPILEYPFAAGITIEDAAKGLFLGEDPINISNDFLISLQNEKVAPRNNFVQIIREDLDNLQPGEYLNDSLVDFWMMWITRKEPAEENNFIIYNTQFYTVMVTHGIEHVMNWSDRKDTDVFSKKNILIPVNKDKHGLLCAVYNAALVDTYVEGVGKEVPFMLFSDPLDYHSRVEVVKNVRSWLNAEWNRKHKTSLNMFNNYTMESFSPKGMFLFVLR
jgi:Ulp1 family protease